MSSRFTLPHIDISQRSVSQTYSARSGFSRHEIRNRVEHGRRIQNELNAAFRMSDDLRPQDPRLPDSEGSYVEVELRKGTKPDILDEKRKGIRTGAAKRTLDESCSVSLYVPDHAREAFQKIVDDYLNGPLTKKANPQNQPKVESIEAFRQARLETFWTDDPAAIPPNPEDEIWWGLWCHKGEENKLEGLCSRLDVTIADKDRWLYFPELSVVPVYTTRATIELLLFASGVVAEIRRASDNPYFYTDEIEGEEYDWMDSLAERTVWPSEQAPAVCILDTGINRAHSLIEPALTPQDMHAVDQEWMVDDHYDPNGHGTAMAGLALHGDLTAPLGDTLERKLKHRLESVKVLAPNGFSPTKPKNYGAVTQAAISLPEIENSERQRIFCMAVTNENISGAIPSAWSSAVDQAAAGTMPGDEETAPKRLLILSAGNIPSEIDPQKILPSRNYPIEDPSQAWNALVVGGYTDRCDIMEGGYDKWTPFVDVGDLSPHSRTSEAWPSNTPFKPELVLEAGNRGISPAQTEVLNFGSLSLLSTGKRPEIPLIPFEGTSAAAAQASRIAAQIVADHPEFWPETVRASMIHSAEWTPRMLEYFGERPGKRDRYELIRRFGYGVPSYERATASAKNDLALFAQAEIQPFRKGSARRNYGDCHYYTLPFPRWKLEELANEQVSLKITLSYFIDPNPGVSANIDPQRYQSHGLRFDLRRKNESLDTFKKRVNTAEREDQKVGPEIESDDGRWMLGAQSISCGSLHCDTWIGPAIELIGRDTVCVKPVMGWSRDRSSIEICNTVRRYALIVSLKTKNTEIDLYTPIITSISPEVQLEIQT